MKFLVWIFVLKCFPLSASAFPRKKVEVQTKNESTDFKGEEYNQPNGSNVEFDANLQDQLSNQNKQGNAESKQEVSLSGTRNVISDANAAKRTPVAAVAGVKALVSNPKVQEAVVEKGIEVAGKLIDKQLQIIEDAQKKASDFLKKRINLDIMPDKGWETEDMFLPPGYHINAAVSGEDESPKEVGQTPYTFPMGIGGVLMNGCWGTGYKANDPCYNAKTTSTICSNMIDGAAFMGVGFDGRGKYSPESRKMSIIQRNCANKATYDGLDVPDTMNVHGIYDTSASLITFESREEYQRHLQQEAGVSGSFFGFSAGVKEAWGESKASASQKYLAVMDIDIDRYEIFVDEVKPKDLSLSFLREFMDLPTSYFAIGAPLKYEAFIQRWGTHYIKSAKFGGQLEIRKTMDASDVKTKKEFEVQMEMEYKSLFSSVGARSSYKEGEKARKQTKTTSTSVVAQGGSQEIASILSDVYSPSFKGEFKEWLKTIPTYPRAFRFQMGFITDLLNFRANDLFPDEKVTWGCEGHAASLLTEEKDGKTFRYYEETTDGKKVKHYCPFESRDALEEAIQARRTSLLRAMEIYMEEGVISLSNLRLGLCHKSSDRQNDKGGETDLWKPRIIPSWKQIIEDKAEFQVSFDMLFGLQNSFQKELDILKNTSRLVRFYDNQWFTSDKNGAFHLYGAFNNGDSKDTSKRKMSILGLILTFNEADGSLSLSQSDYNVSKRFYPTLSEEMIGRELARLQLETGAEKPHRKSETGVPASKVPCMVIFSNALRLDPTNTNGKCLHFTASSKGSLFVIFALLPNNRKTWYYVEISPDIVATYKGQERQTYTTNQNALALGDTHLYQSYFVCITETEKSTLIEYGKSLGTSDSGDIYLNMVDSENHLNARFYGFGTISKTSTKIMDTHIIPRALTKADCKGDTVRDLDTDLCIKKCHLSCDPVAGCRDATSSNLRTGCYACRHALDIETNNCIPSCPQHKSLTREKKCVPTYDLLIKESSDFNQMKIRGVPTLKEMTVCVWVHLERYSGPSDIPGFMDLVLYAREYIYWADSFEITLGHSGDNIAFLYGMSGSGSDWVMCNQLKDKKWHQLCITRSGATGVVLHYIDGKRVASKTYPKGTINGGGFLRFGRGGNRATVAMTEFNMWDRILTDQELKKNAESCHEGKGNVKQWHELYDVVRPKTEFFRRRSTCAAPPRTTK